MAAKAKARSICHLRQTLQPHEVLENMNAHLESLEYRSEVENAWIMATEAYIESNGKYTTYEDLPGNKQQHRDSILNETIFKGLFPPGILTFKFILAGTRKWTRNEDGDSVAGITGCRYSGHHTTHLEIVVKVLVYEDLRFRRNGTRMRYQTSTLLHELVHALVDAYTCRCQRCEKGSEEGIGVTGHGPVWMAISLKIEKTMERIFRCQCWLGRSQSLAVEHHARQHRHSEKELRADEVNERIYCQERISSGENEPDKSIPFDEAHFTRKEADGELDLTGLGSDYSEDDCSEDDYFADEDEDEVDNPGHDCP
ncbi:hypothetical protein IFR05_005112 [Cadophora sp. M221]|nr:hypothetical protein IFR05_005112 [Cadophora sp. M221]